MGGMAFRAHREIHAVAGTGRGPRSSRPRWVFDEGGGGRSGRAGILHGRGGGVGRWSFLVGESAGLHGRGRCVGGMIRWWGAQAKWDSLHGRGNLNNKAGGEKKDEAWRPLIS
ncbi:hypothetical protein LY76DRAFT_403743 [Colletotrichum caudatum]|nr:hypothetical protein LY76DRAFT_403743 [Colletotrichum caudatum]